MTRIILATNNPGKLAEIRALLGELDLELATPEQLGIRLQVEESGQTYIENAARKGLAFAKASGLLTLADDSGLEVDALNGQPGVFSARFSTLPGASDADRRTILLKKLWGLPRPWTACFRCLVALVTPQEEVYFSEGVCPGEIIPEERGFNGFGYDPIFLLPEVGRTMAELRMEEKNRLSHRARAILAARPTLAYMTSNT
jgi:XTP/dITP diphosphohydrolase